MKKTAFLLSVIMVWVTTFCQSNWSYSFDMTKISKCIALAHQHQGTFRGIVTKISYPSPGDLDLRNHIVDPTPGKSGAYYTVNVSNAKKTFIYQKGDSTLLTVQTTDYQKTSHGAYYGNAVLVVKGKVVLITSWLEGCVQADLIHIHRWSSKGYVLSNLEGTILKRVPNGAPSTLSLTALYIIEADISLALSEPLDPSPEVSKKVYAVLDNQYTAEYGSGFDNADDLRILIHNKESLLMRVDGVSKTWTISSVKLLKDPLITKETGTETIMYTNPDFNVNRDRVEIEFTDRAQKLKLLEEF